MELLAVIVALESLTRHGLDITVYTDSAYVVNSVEKKWVFGWKQKGFAGKKNPDLWTDFLNLYPLYHIQFRWIKGHNGHPENERCDELAVAASKQKDLLIDSVFEI